MTEFLIFLCFLVLASIWEKLNEIHELMKGWEKRRKEASR